MPLISIALATYNGEKYISEQIESILNQSIKDFELIICDDCSSDSTYKLVLDYKKKDNRIIVTQNESNIGFKKNFEKLLSLAKAEYVAFSDQDDIWMPNHLELLYNNISTNDLITANAELIDTNGRSLNATLRDSDKIAKIPVSKEKKIFTLLYRNFSQGNTTLVRKEFLNKALPIPNEVKYHDQWFGLIASLNNGIGYLEQPITKYRQHGDNVTTHVKWNSLAKIKELLFGDGNKNLYIEQLSFLKALLVLDCIKQYNIDKYIKEAIEFYNNFVIGKQYNSLVFFLKNYNAIYLSKNIVYFLIRLIIIFLLRK